MEILLNLFYLPFDCKYTVANNDSESLLKTDRELKVTFFPDDHLNIYLLTNKLIKKLIFASLI